MPRVRFTQRSRADLGDIFDYIAADSPRAAQTMVDRIVLRAATLREQPLSGHPRDDLRPGLRSLRCGAYVILYEPHPGYVIIAHIAHHARNLPAIVARDPEV
jgi:toxin ParE1/3/4